MIAQFVPEAVRRPRRLWLRSLTSKLVAGVVALVVVLVLAIGATTYYFLSSFLYHRLDQQVAPIAAFNEDHIAQCLGRGVAQCGLGQGQGGSYRAPQTEWLAVLGQSGKSMIPVTSSTSLKPMALSLSQGRQLVGHPGVTESIVTTDGVRLRVSARAINVGPTEFVVVSGLPTDEVTNTLHQLFRIELIIGAGAVLAAFAATAFGVQRSLRNLFKVTGTAREVTAELSPEGAGLDRRVPVVEKGTEVGQLAESVNTLLSAVETQFAARVESENRMRQFLADASHELRTPLTSIRGFAELARMQRAAGTYADDNLDRIESEGTRMSRLVEDLLILARTDSADYAHALQREPVEIEEMLDDVAAGSRAAFPQRQIDVHLDDVPTVLGDRDQLVRAVRNLVTNACMHTRADAAILLRSFPDGPWVAIQVIDGGPGLPPEQAAHVFERFWRADKARSRVRGGTGLGMSIVATIVRAHGGSVRFDSSVDSGSTATVWLPAAG